MSLTKVSFSMVDGALINVLDFGADPTGVSDSTAAIQSAIDAGQSVYLPEGNYLISELFINKNNFTLTGAGINASILTTTVEAKVAITVANTVITSGTYLRDFKIQGNSTNLGGIKLGNPTYPATGPVLDMVSVWNFERTSGSNGYGIQLNSVQNCDIHNCFIYRNTHNIQRLTGSGYCTSTRITGKFGYLGGNPQSKVGAYIDAYATDIEFDGVIIEGNAQEGIYVTANAVETTKATRININNCYFEANNASGGGVIRIVGTAGAYEQHTASITQCKFALNSGNFIRLDQAIAYISTSDALPGLISTTASCNVRFDTMRYPNGSDYIADYKAMLGNIIVTDFNAPFDGTYRNQFNYVNALTFPDSPRYVTDQYTLDGYRKGTWVPVITLGAGSGTVTVTEANYTQVGKRVWFDLLLNVSAFTSVVTSTRISLPTPIKENFASVTVIGSLPITDLGPSWADKTTQDLLLPSFGSITTTALYISGNYLVP